VRGVVGVYGVEDSVAGQPEDRSGREEVFRDQSYIDFVHIEKRLEFQTMRRKAVGVPESNTHGDSHYAVRRGRTAISMVSIVLVCSISWLNKDLNSVRKAESCAPSSTDWEPEATTWEYGAGGVLEGGTGG
jgi:hypothetical protein